MFLRNLINKENMKGIFPLTYFLIVKIIKICKCLQPPKTRGRYKKEPFLLLEFYPSSLNLNILIPF